MGNFYVSLALGTENRDAVVALLDNVPDTGVVAPAADGWVVFSTAQLETQDERVIDEYGTAISRHGVPVLAVMNHDDDILTVVLYRNDRRVARAVTDPGYFAGEELPPEIDGAGEIAALADGVSAEEVQNVLSGDEVFAVDTHQKLAALLGLPPASVGFGYGYFERGEFGPDGYTRTGQSKETP